MTIALSFILFLAGFIGIGLWSVRHAKKSNADYLLASQSLPSWMAGLSAMATNNSGFMFIGLIGMTYTMGLSAMWLMIGWIVGDLMGSLLIHQKLRHQTEEISAHTFSEALASWKKDLLLPKYRAVSAVITILFLGTYAAAQLNAGSKALYVLFGWDYETGALIGAAMVLAYCWAGGIRASVWTDVAQSVVMVISMAVLIWVAYDNIGGVNTLMSKLSAIDPALTSIFPQDLAFGPALFVLGWLGAGLGVTGQPHIMIRFMAIDESTNIRKSLAVYYSAYVIFSIMAVLVGLAARLLLVTEGQFDPELALPQLAMNFLPDVMVGLILAGLFAATMSTADSQILSCAAALTSDLYKKKTRWVTKGGTVLIAALTLSVALYGSESVFDLVVIAWSVLAVTFSPILILRIFNAPLADMQALTMSGVGLCTIAVWRYFGLSNDLYEVLPGLAMSLATYGLWMLCSMSLRALRSKTRL